MTLYTQIQIIKHALQHYIQRPGATEKDLIREKRLLEYYTQRAEHLKEKYGIRRG